VEIDLELDGVDVKLALGDELRVKVTLRDGERMEPRALSMAISNK
jgi:hypothetical protein